MSDDLFMKIIDQTFKAFFLFGIVVWFGWIIWFSWSFAVKPAIAWAKR